MKACFLPIGPSIQKLLPSVLSAFSGGITDVLPPFSVLSVSDSASSAPVSGLIADLNKLSGLFSSTDNISCFSTQYEYDHWNLSFPDPETLTLPDNFSVLFSSLYGKNHGPDVRHNSILTEWLLRTWLISDDNRCNPVYRLLGNLKADSMKSANIRLVFLADLSDSYSVGVTMALLNWFRSELPDSNISLLGLSLAQGSSLKNGLSLLKSTLSDMSDRMLVRDTDGRETNGADSVWILGLPSSVISSDDSFRILAFAAARQTARIIASPSHPSCGFHSVRLPATLSIRSLDKEASGTLSFCLASVWFLADLLPSVYNYLDHPTILKSISPTSRNSLFRRLFRNTDPDSNIRDCFETLERVLKIVLLEELTLIRTLPDPFRSSESEDELWQKAHRLCGQAVTLTAEYDVAKAEIMASGLDKVRPVHRVSMADTEEEKVLRHLDDMSVQMNNIMEERNSALGNLYAFRVRQLLDDCLLLCQEAKKNAEDKVSDIPDGKLLRQARERRIRLLQAAIDRCEKDLDLYASFPKLSEVGAVRVSAHLPFAGDILDPDLAEACFRMLTEPSSFDSFAVTVRDRLDKLFVGYQSIDAKMLFRSLVSYVSDHSESKSALSLFPSLVRICSDSVSSRHTDSGSNLPDTVLLPDCSGTGIIPTLSALSRLLVADTEADTVASRRGIIAMLLLCQYRRKTPDDSVAEYDCFSRGSSPTVDVWLDMNHSDRVYTVSLRKGAQITPVAMIYPGRSPVPSPIIGTDARLIPAFVTWFNRETCEWMDPCSLLSESDRSVLTEQLTRCRKVLGDTSRELSTFISDFYQDIVRKHNSQETDPLLPLRLKSACALSGLKSWQTTVRRVPAYYDHFVRNDEFCSVLTGSPKFEPSCCNVIDEVQYFCNGKPFARENAETLLESTGCPGEESLLNTLDSECQLLSRSSDDYRDALTEGLNYLLNKYPAASEQAKKIAENLLREAQSSLDGHDTVLTWPWDTESPSVCTILSECVGEELGKAALTPFSDFLVLFPARGGELFGDSLFSSMCILQRSGEASDTDYSVTAKDAVLPPLSESFSASLCRLPEGRLLIQPGFMEFIRKENTVTCTLTLKGAFTLQLVRKWSDSEILSLYSRSLPTLALWPSVPYKLQDWQAYFVYAHCEDTWHVSAITADEVIPVSGSDQRYSACLKSYPVCFSLERNGHTVGTLPNLLPVPVASVGGTATVSVDFGSSSTSVLISSDAGSSFLEGASATRLLIKEPSSASELLRKEFLPVGTFGPFFPSCVLIFRNVPGAAPIPFVDGIIFPDNETSHLLSAPMDKLCTAFKADGNRSRATELYLHELMLLAAHQVRSEGYTGLSWRFSLPDDISSDARSGLMNLLHDLTEKVSLESGLFSPANCPLLLVCNSSTALGAYCRNISPESCAEGFMVLDPGFRTVRMSLFLHGYEEAFRSCSISDGLAWLLLPSLIRDPDILISDFGNQASEPLLSDLSSLKALLHDGRSEHHFLRCLLPVLDSVVISHGQELHTIILSGMMQQSPTWTGSLLLFNLCKLMMLCSLGLIPEASEAARGNLLPERITLFITGNGARQFESLSEYTISALNRFLGMFRNPRIQEVRLATSPDKNVEISSGLTAVTHMTALFPDTVPVSPSFPFRMDDLISEFLLRFLDEFPAEAALLFPDFYTGDPYTPFTPRARQILEEASSQAGADSSVKSPYTFISSWLSGLPELLREE